MTSYFRQKLQSSFNKLSSSSSSSSSIDKDKPNGTSEVAAVESESDDAAVAVEVAAAAAETNGQQDQIQTFDEELERSKIKEIRSLIVSQHPYFSQDVDDLMIRRFLRARDLDIEKSWKMLLNYLKWRKEFIPNGFISPSQIPNEIAHNKLFMQGLDKLGRPVIVVFGGRHKQANLDEFKCFVTFCLDKICSRMPDGLEKFVAIADLEGWGYTNSDIRGYIAALSILQDCYPERLGKLLLVHVPSVFMTAWKVIYPFIDSKTKKKIVFVENKKLKPTLLIDIDESQLPETYGGKLALVPIQDC